MDLKILIILLMLFSIIIYLFIEFKRLNNYIKTGFGELTTELEITKKQIQNHISISSNEIKNYTTETIQQIRKMNIIHNQPFKKANHFTEDYSDPEQTKNMSDSYNGSKKNTAEELYMSDDKNEPNEPVIEENHEHPPVQKAQPEPQSQPIQKTEPKSEAVPEQKTEPKSEAVAEQKTEAKSEAVPELKAQAEAEAEAEEESESKSDEEDNQEPKIVTKSKPATKIEEKDENGGVYNDSESEKKSIIKDIDIDKLNNNKYTLEYIKQVAKQYKIPVSWKTEEGKWKQCTKAELTESVKNIL